MLDTPRWVVGAHGAVASGGGEPGESDAFQQTSLESNRSRFTGTRSQVPRFGEAIQPEWSNIRVLTFYTALSDRDTWDANLLYHRYWLSDENGAVRSDLVEPGFTGSSDDLGQSVDLTAAFPSGFSSGIRSGVAITTTIAVITTETSRRRQRTVLLAPINWRAPSVG